MFFFSKILPRIHKSHAADPNGSADPRLGTPDVNTTLNYTKETILKDIRQQIYLDEIDLIYMNQIATVRVQKPLLAYDVGFKGTFVTLFYK